MNADRKENKKRFVASAFVWLVALACLATLVVAQEEPLDSPIMVLEEADYAAEETTYAEEPVYIVEDSAVNFEEDVDIEPLNPETIQTLTLKKGMSIADALRFLALKYKKNIVPTATVSGNITITDLYDVTFEEALQALIGTNKFDIQGNFIMVYTAEEYEQIKSNKRRMEYRIFTLYYINSDEATKIVEPLLSDSGRMGSTTAAPSEMEAGKSGDTLAINDRLVVSDFPENLEQIREVLAEVDIEPMQVLLEVTVMEATLTEETKFGIDWTNLTAVDLAADFTLGTNGMQTVFAPTIVSGAAGTGGGIVAGITVDDVSTVITALEAITDVTIMANPKILALNKQAGKLIIGREDGYLTLTNITDGGTATQKVEMLESGTILEFRPFIGRDGMIRMEIHPEQSDGSINDSGLPVKTTTEVITNVMVRDGQTIVLGGLFKEKTTLGRSQVPVLGNIPFIGELFQGTADKSERVELIILITPHIIKTPEDANGNERLEDVKRLTYQARTNITWASRTKIAEDRYKKAVELYTNGDLDGALSQLTGKNLMHRSYLDAERLKERIINELQPSDGTQIERIMLDAIEKQESNKWFRR